MTTRGDEPPSPSEASDDAYERAKKGVALNEQLPELDFSMFVLSLAHSSWVHLGDAPDPAGGDPELNLPMARQTIDLLALIQEKTRGNLNGDEERVLGQVLYDLRMRYVEVVKSR